MRLVNLERPMAKKICSEAVVESNSSSLSIIFAPILENLASLLFHRPAWLVGLRLPGESLSMAELRATSI